MPIEFACSACGKLLRTPDDTAGREARCPACQSITVVPQPGGAALPGGAVPPPSYMPRPDAPMNAYQSPLADMTSPPTVARARSFPPCLIWAA